MIKPLLISCAIVGLSACGLSKPPIEPTPIVYIDNRTETEQIEDVIGKGNYHNYEARIQFIMWQRKGCMPDKEYMTQFWSCFRYSQEYRNKICMRNHDVYQTCGHYDNKLDAEQTRYTYIYQKMGYTFRDSYDKAVAKMESLSISQ